MIHWSQNKTHLVVYHGTHIKNVPGIMKNGISNKDPKTGMVSVAIGSHGADVAHGYAAMSGEHGFRQAGSRAVTVPPQHRAIITAHIPMDWVRRNVDQNFGGNPDRVKRRLASKNIHNIHVAATGSDFSPSETPELRFKKAIPAKYIVGVSQKAKKMKTFKEFSETVSFQGKKMVMAGQPCKKCDGTYQRGHRQEPFDNTVSCNNCGHKVSRLLTPKLNVADEEMTASAIPTNKASGDAIVNPNIKKLFDVKLRFAELRKRQLRQGVGH